MGEMGSLDNSRTASPPSPPLSPSSPSSSATSFPSLPIMALRDRIVAKIQENRVTLIVGDTGCGKSSQVPQFLLEENMHPILCTQPRRFAVVAIARMVAEARNCEVGEEVGYHIGHSNVSSTSTKIVFKTAGVLLEQMRDKGLSALKYKVIILDEVHERSVESDLVLACIKQFMMRNKDLRVVLMSATADISRYRDYFRDLRHNERVEVLAIPNTSKQTIFQRKVLYLEQVAELIGINPDSLLDKYCSSSGSAFGDAAMNPEVHTLIHKLILHIHENEPHLEKSILVFLPTYHSLEQQWILLKPHLSSFKVHILHRSIDTQQALSAMRVWKSHRKVILATNIAESSVTIPGVAFVIDSCRSLQVFWDHKRKKDATELVWVSKSQAEQRKGRTGRTCDGQIYRLVTGTLYNNLNDHEFPAILRLSLKQQVLMICCAESKAINDPKVLLQKVMDPPPCDVIEDALNVLVHIQALEKIHSHRGRYGVTFYGRLLDSLPLSFDAAVLLLKFGEVGLLREGIIIASLMDIQPLPILQPFGQPDLFSQYLNSYFEDDRGIGKKEIIFMGNLCAFRFWERVFLDEHRLDHLKQIVKVCVPRAQSSPIYQLEDEWCYLHNLTPTALHNLSEIYEDVLSIIHRFRPKFLHVADGPPLYYEPDEFKHTCFLQVEADEVDANNENPEASLDNKCLALPYVGLKDFQSTFVADKLSELVKEMRVQNSENPSHDMRGSMDSVDGISPVLCKFFVNGSCYNGDQCLFSHSLQARRPQCKFFFTLQGCRFGDSCFFSHDLDSHLSSSTTSRVFLPEDEDACPATFLNHLPTSDNGSVIIFNDNESQFTSKLSEKYNPKKIIVARNRSHLSGSDTSSIGVTELFSVSQPWDTILESKEKSAIPWENVQCVLWFADFEENETVVHQRHLGKFLESLAIRILGDTLSNIQIMIIMNNIKFSHLQVERLARDCFFFLRNSFPLDTATFGCLSGAFNRIRPMEASLPICYVFSMHPPTEELFGDYSSQLRLGLYNNI